MARHWFGILPERPPAGVRYDLFEPERYGCIAVEDELIEPLLERLTGVECFAHTIDCPIQGLAYCGITLIPPDVFPQLVRVLGNEDAFAALTDMVMEAALQDRFLIHFGI